MSLLVFPLFACLGDLSKEAEVTRIVLSFATLGVLGDEDGFHEVVKLVQVDKALVLAKRSRLGVPRSLWCGSAIPQGIPPEGAV